jgi:hypothetical protein
MAKRPEPATGVGSGLMEAFDRFWQWANKPVDSHETIPAELHHAVTSLPMEERTSKPKSRSA